MDKSRRIDYFIHIPKVLLNYIFSFVRNPKILLVSKRFNEVGKRHLNRLKWLWFLDHYKTLDDEEKYEVNNYIDLYNMSFEVFKYIYPTIKPQSVNFQSVQEMGYAIHVGYTNFWNIVNADDIEMVKIAFKYLEVWSPHCLNGKLTVEKLMLILKITQPRFIEVSEVEIARILHSKGITEVIVKTDDLETFKGISAYYPNYNDVMSSSNVQLVEYAFNMGGNINRCFESSSLDVVKFGYKNGCGDYQRLFTSHNIEIVKFAHELWPNHHATYYVNLYRSDDIELLRYLLEKEEIPAYKLMSSRDKDVALLAIEYGATNFEDFCFGEDYDMFTKITRGDPAKMRLWPICDNPNIIREIYPHVTLHRTQAPIYELISNFCETETQVLGSDFYRYAWKNGHRIIRESNDIDVLLTMF